MNYQTLQLNLDDRGVLTVVLNRPEVRNAFNDKLVTELTEVFTEKAKDPSVKAVVLRGNGRVFCAGGDLNWLKSGVAWTFERNLEDARALARMLALINEFSKPVIGAIHGAAMGGGLGLVSICDIAIATQDALFSFSEVRLGIIPACISPFVIAKIGVSHARELFISAEQFKARKAKDIGLIHEVATDAIGLETAVDHVVANVLQCGPMAMKAAKELVLELSWPERRALRQDPLEYVARMLAELRVTPEAQEGINAFLEKRKPSWTTRNP